MGLKIPLTFSSYNCRGLGIDRNVNDNNVDNDEDTTKYDTITELLAKSDFCLIQEHWLYVQEFAHMVNTKLNNVAFLANSPMDESEQRMGRPKGGTAILYKSNINAKVVRVHSDCDRLTVASVSVNAFTFLIFSVYMPCDERRAGENLDEFTEVLNEIHSICLNSDCQYFIIGGDLNCDVSRNVPQTHALNTFIEQENFTLCLNHNVANVPYTYTKGDTLSALDHFIVTPNLLDSIVKYETDFIANNFSDHLPVLLQLNIDIDYHNMQKTPPNPGIAWEKCTQDNHEHYHKEIDSQIDDIDLSFDVFACSDYNCKCHSGDLCAWYIKLVNMLLNASKVSLPTAGSKENTKVIPGWNELVKPKLDSSLFWHKIWVDSGRPRNGLVADIMRRTRAQYHHAVKYAHKNINEIRNKRMAEAISTNNQRNLWKEAKALNGPRGKLPNIIDSMKGDENIVPIFFDKYKSLYNTVGYTQSVVDELKTEIDGMIKDHCADKSHMQNDSINNSEKHFHVLHRKDLVDAIEKLKEGKKEDSGLYSNHLKLATDKFKTLLTMFFNAMLRHGTAPDDLLLGTMFPLIKDSRGNAQSSDNYRAITIGTCISKLFEIIILKKQTYAFHTGDLQFGFKENSSPVVCSFVAQEVINHYINNNSNVYTVMLDASKAFDRVNFIKLFRKLIDKKMCPLVIRLLLNSYTNQKLNVRWNVTLSESFGVSNGVRQGGILSPILFGIYMDELLNRLKSSDIGCHMGLHYVGALGFADDITLLCPSLSGIKTMLSICEQFAAEYDLIFNGTKSKLLIFSKGNQDIPDPCIKLNGVVINRFDKAVHLGNTFHTKRDYECIEDGIRTFNRTVNMFLYRFKTCNPSIKIKLFQQYCMALYGSQIWPLWQNNIGDLCTKWNVAIRRILGVPNRTHRDLLPLITGLPPVEVSLHCRLIKFYRSLNKSKNPIVKYISEYAVTAANSPLGRNVRLVASKICLPPSELISLSENKLKDICYNKWYTMVNDTYKVHASVIRDMIDMRDSSDQNFFDKASCEAIIQHLCVI